MIAAHDGAGVAVFIRDPSRTALSDRYVEWRPQPPQDRLRDYGLGAEILRDLNIEQLILLTSSEVKLASLSGFGLTIVGRLPIQHFPDERA